MDMNLGDTRLILDKCRLYGLLRNQAAYILATAYWETAHTMRPVVEAYWLSEEWRAANLRYYPWHGRGYVQLTWEENYQRVKREFGADVTGNPDLLLTDADLSARVLVVGCMEGWFTGRKLGDYITLERSDYVGARRVVNGTDKAHAIAELARDYEAALLAEGYGVERPAPVVNERRDGTPPRETAKDSTTIRALIRDWAGTLGLTAAGVIGWWEAQDKMTQGMLIGSAVLIVVALILSGQAKGHIWKERMRKWMDGDR